MRIAILGYGLEGQSVEKYFKKKGAEIDIFEKFSPDLKLNPEEYDYIFRSPSIPLHQIPESWHHRLTSSTEYFFENCDAQIIGVTGTKGKGTVCTMTTQLVEATSKHKVLLLGNIGNPALDYLDDISAKTDIVVYELSSFQLWNLKNASPNVAVVLRIEPDHLNVHKNFDDYVAAKSNITKWQSRQDIVVYFQYCQESCEIAMQSSGLRLPYPFNLTPSIPDNDMLLNLLNELPLAGNHNKENLQAALLATYAAHLERMRLDMSEYSIEMFLADNFTQLKRAIQNLQPLPHRMEFVRELNGVKYYDDNYSSAFPSLDVAISAFDFQKVVLIAGGQDRGLDLANTQKRLASAKNLSKVILIGETREKLAKKLPKDKYILANGLEDAIEKAREIAEQEKAYVIMSPGAPSFDMFKNFKDRGEKFQAIIKDLK